MERLVNLWQVGKISYSKALNLQKQLADLHNNSQSLNDTLLCVEHPPVYTTGIRNKQYTAEEEAKLRSKGAEFFRTDRGGLITFHGPGQLVVYPVINLKHFKPSVKWYVTQIEYTVIKVCEHFGLNAETSPYTGVWVGDKKICAIGIHGSRFIMTHGLALNCSTDLSWFDHIIPCGIEGKGVTSLSQELKKPVNIEEVLPVFFKCFKNVFQCEFQKFSKEEAEVLLQNLK